MPHLGIDLCWRRDRLRDFLAKNFAEPLAQPMDADPQRSLAQAGAPGQRAVIQRSSIRREAFLDLFKFVLFS